MNNITNKEIEKLQENLQTIRKAGGWSAEDFGEMIGVTKQTVRNLENKNTTMSKTQYIAIRSVLDYGMKERKNDDILNSIVKIFLSPVDLPAVDMKKARTFFDGVSKKEFDAAYIIGGLAAFIGATVIETLLKKNTESWMSKIMKK